jgi:hypothetical protein
MVSAELTPATQLFKDRLEFIPERCTALIAVVFGWCRLCCAQGFDAGNVSIKPASSLLFPVDGSGFLGIGGVLSIGAGSNFSTIFGKRTCPQLRRSPRNEGNRPG